MSPFARFPEPLCGDAVCLRLAAERDIPEILIAHQDDPELFRRLRSERPPSGAELGRATELAEAERALGSRLWLTILTPDCDDCRGQIDVHDAEPHYARADLDLWVVPQRRNQGLASAALALAGRWLLQDAGFARVQLFIDPGNAPMLAVAARAGFTYEGLMRGYWRERRGRRDAQAWALVRPDLDSASRS